MAQEKYNQESPNFRQRGKCLKKAHKYLVSEFPGQPTVTSYQAVLAYRFVL